MTTHDCRSELLVAARRGRLSEAGRLALEAHLAGCASCRSSYDVSSDFDAAEAIDLHDGVRIRALADLARQRVRAARQVDRRSGARAVAAGAARPDHFCGLGQRRRLVVAAAGFVARDGGARTGRTAARRTVPGGSSRVACGDRGGSDARAPGRPAADAPTRSSGPRAGAASDLAGAAAILQQATEARQQGERRRAADLYRQLQREFPASSEAVLSTVALGGLLLDDGLPRAALTEFDGYLAKGGGLIPEALYGRARALGQLGDRAREREAWTRLCADFPESAYAQLGRHRLAEIE